VHRNLLQKDACGQCLIRALCCDERAPPRDPNDENDEDDEDDKDDENDDTRGRTSR
jgi:hypothetical protein